MTRNPSRSRWARICPARPAPKASGLMIVSVRLPAMSGSYEFTNDVAASQQSDQAPAANHRNPVDFLVRHDRRHFGEGLIGRDAEHLARHDVAHEPARRARWSLAR